jgi:uncharacterized protein (TIGR02145 family)
MIVLRKSAVLFVLLIIAVKLLAQNYELIFTGSGESDSVDSVLIENLTRGTNLTIDGGDILHLVNLVTGINTPGQDNLGKLAVYPNPSPDYSNLEFESLAPGPVNIEILDLSGRILLSSHNLLPAGRHTFQVQGLSHGIYLANVITNTNSCSGRIVSTNLQQQLPVLKYVNSETAPSKMKASLKSSTSEITMQYNGDDLLKFTCFSGNYSTVIMDVPTGSKSIPSVFVACTDKDNNNYPVVHIGKQTWMAENLKTTRYANGNEIDYSADSLAWTNSSAGSYCIYHDSIQYREVNGLLYNWKAVVDSNNLCPAGWHIPTDAEWTILETSLGGERQAGERLKETGTDFWKDGNPNANNESGFSGRPAGYRGNTGIYSGYGDEAGWWTSAAAYEDSAWIFSVDKSTTRLNRSVVSVLSGYSVRCISGIPGLPVVLTDSIYPIEISTATANAIITTDGGAPVIERGVCWSLTLNPTILDSHTSDSLGTGRFVSHLAGLTPGATYHIRAYATNTIGTAYGADSSFITRTEASVPIISTGKVYVINSTSAAAAGNVISDGGDEITARGVCWSLSASPTADLSTKTTDGKGTGVFKSQLSGLSSGTTYHIRAYATNGVGTAYGKETTFSIVMNESGPQVTDIDGNVYKTVYIGNQLWMAENLKTRHYRDQTEIPSAPLTSREWLGLTTGALCYYDNDELNNKNIYGPLYNWYAVADERTLCPSGWHIPSNDEFMELRDYLGGLTIAGAKMKETESGLWDFPNTGADNSSGFTALPGGDRDDGEFGSIHNGTGWWSSTEVDKKDAWSHYLYYSSTSFFPSPDDKVSGCSVRCIKD